MDFTPSDCISALALFVSLLSAYYAKKQNEFSKVSHHDDYRNHLSGNHEKYRLALKQASLREKQEISTLSHEAGNAVDAIVSLLDEYDTGDHRVPYLRHLLHESAEMVFYAFKGQLGWQTGANISFRFSSIMHMDDRLEPAGNFFGKDFRRQFEADYFQDPNAHQEFKLLHDKHFIDLVTQMVDRVDASKRVELIAIIQALLDQFNELFAELKPKVRETSDHLGELLKEGELEHFPIHESPKLFARLEYKKATLDSLSNMRLFAISPDHSHYHRNLVPWILHTCSMLRTIQGFHSWGWNDFEI